MFKTHVGRSRVLAAAVAAAALATAGSVAMTAPAQSADPTGDCATATPVSSLAKGDAVTGLTVDGVDSGTTPSAFTGTILGVLQDGIAPGIDMVMARLSSPEIDRVGIWQGMSGSPVYAQDGSLIGAVAYGLSYGPSPVAGITPYAEMDDYMGDAAAPARIKVGDAQARTIARSSDATTAEAQEGFRQMRMPMTINGLSQGRLNKALRHADKKDKRLFKGMWAAGGSGTASTGSAATAADLVAGGNLAAEISYGDITAAGVGTATSVCEGRVVGFGHPMNFMGKTSLGLAPADALYIQEDPAYVGFKVANISEPVGTITDDHLTGITGTFGALPDATDITSDVSYGSRERTGTSHSLVQDANADIFFSQVLANQDRVIDAIMPGTSDVTYTVNGTDADGNPFTINVADQYESDWDISFESIWDLADVTYLLSRMDGVELDDVTAGSQVSDSTATWRIQSVEQKVGKTWTKVNRRNPVMGMRGQLVQLRATLNGTDGTTVVPLSVKIPKSAKRSGFLSVVGGNSMWNNAVYRASTPTEMAAALAKGATNNEVAATTSFGRGRTRTTSTSASAPQSHVVNGYKFAEIFIVG